MLRSGASLASIAAKEAVTRAGCDVCYKRASRSIAIPIVSSVTSSIRSTKRLGQLRHDASFATSVRRAKASTEASTSTNAENSNAPSTSANPARTGRMAEGEAQETGQEDTAAEVNPQENTSKQPRPLMTSSQAALDDKKPLPRLSSPLGVDQAPSSRVLTWVERREQHFDYERRLSRRKAIVKEATQGYFRDFHAMRSHGGKTWIAPTTLIRQDRALYFPSIKGVSLADKTEKNTADILYGKVSVVTFLTSQLSELHAKSFYEPVLARCGKNSNFQLVQINLQENRIKAYLVSLFLSSLRKQIPPELHATYLLSHQNLLTEREALRLDNKHVGYTYLVGPDGKIRWAGSGFAEPEEQQSLVVCASVLLNRSAEAAAASKPQNKRQ